MIVILSPAKRIQTSEKLSAKYATIPENIDLSEKLIKHLSKYSEKQLQKLMGINAKIATENVERFIRWNRNFSIENAIQSIVAFNGEVYNGLNALDFSDDEIEFAQCHIRILSGLHGILRPLDLIMPYRLEMGLKLKVEGFKDLYEFWGDIITHRIVKDLELIESDVIMNLASAEYYKSINITSLKNYRIISPDFREYKEGKYRFVHVFGKKARGLMARFIVKNKITEPENIKLFDLEGYEYNDHLTNADNWVFTRG